MGAYEDTSGPKVQAAEPEPIAPPPPGHSGGTRKWWSHGPTITIVLLSLVVVTLGAMWVSADSRAEKAETRVDRLKRQVADFEAKDAAEQKAADELPDLKAVADAVRKYSYGLSFSGDKTTLDVTVPTPSTEAMEWLDEFMAEVGLPPATGRRMEQTRALDGTLEAHGDHVSVTWTYHPDDGLSAVFSCDQ